MVSVDSFEKEPMDLNECRTNSRHDIVEHSGWVSQAVGDGDGVDQCEVG